MDMKKIHSLINRLYHLLCLGAFLWQTIELSMNYFQYKTVSNIEMMMPGSEYPKAINVCFDNRQFFDSDKYWNMFYKMNSTGRFPAEVSTWNDFMTGVISTYFTIAERFNISYQDPFHGQTNQTIMYTMSYATCYHNVMKNQEKVSGKLDVRIAHNTFAETINFLEISAEQRTNINGMVVAMTDNYKLAHSDYRKWENIGVEPNMEHTYAVSSYYHKLHKLKTPYIDECVNYSDTRYANREEAISDCANDIEVKNRKLAARQKIFTQGTDYPLSWKEDTIDIVGSCEKIFPHPDCDIEHTITGMRRLMKPDPKKYKNVEADIIVYNILSLSPSYILINSAKIANVVFISFIHTWFGFCFLMINPADLIQKYFLSENTSLPDAMTNQSLYEQQIDTDKKMLRMKKRNFYHKVRIVQIEKAYENLCKKILVK